ncbi:MAG: hypothetical protein P4L27_14260, partial [Ignavibacteriaceae bacterium]|nr:hypothetical protein [Ignavibacteriaceae bacterium]
FNNYGTGDYSIKSGSSAIKAGTSVGLTTDLENNSVPVNYPDIGAFQYPNNKYVLVNIKVLIEGLYDNGNCSTYFNSHNLIPLSQPYHSYPWNYSGSESVSKIPSDVLDWILVELRSTIANYSIIARRAAFLKSDGSIVDLDGVSPLKFDNINYGNYYIVIKYNNAIETWSKEGGVLFSDTNISYDFTTSQNQAYGNNLLKMENKWCIYSGDLNHNGIVDDDDYRSIENDNDLATYHIANDLNRDGVVDLSDLCIVYSNRSANITRIIPPGAQ